MEMIAWRWWVLSSLLSALFSVVWFLLSGWVLTVLQLALLVAVICALKYRLAQSHLRFGAEHDRSRDSSGDG